MLLLCVLFCFIVPGWILQFYTLPYLPHSTPALYIAWPYCAGSKRLLYPVLYALSTFLFWVRFCCHLPAFTCTGCMYTCLLLQQFYIPFIASLTALFSPPTFCISFLSSFYLLLDGSGFSSFSHHTYSSCYIHTHLLHTNGSMILPFFFSFLLHNTPTYTTYMHTYPFLPSSCFSSTAFLLFFFPSSVKQHNACLLRCQFCCLPAGIHLPFSSQVGFYC